MKEMPRISLTSEAEKAHELGWLKEHIAVFWPAASVNLAGNGVGESFRSVIK